MNYLIHLLLNPEELLFLKSNLDKKNIPWEDGKKTAGGYASKVKNNLQINRQSEISKKFSTLIKKKILNDDLIKSFALPRQIHSIMFTKSITGMGYGRHIDNAYMSSGRADLSFTIFLSEESQYGGGELFIETLNSE